MAIEVQLPPLEFGARDVFHLATAIRDTGALPDFLSAAEDKSGEFEGRFAQSIVRHVGSIGSRKAVTGLQLLQLSFEIAKILVRCRYPDDLTIDDVEGALEEASEKLILTGVEFSSWLAGVRACLGDQVANERVLPLMAAFAVTIGLVGAATAIPILIVLGTILTELDPLNRITAGRTRSEVIARDKGCPCLTRKADHESTKHARCSSPVLEQRITAPSPHPGTPTELA